MIAIRPLTPDDGETYRALRLRGLAEHPDAFTSDFAQEAAKSLATLARRIAPPPDAPHNRVFGAFDGASLVGVVGFEIEPRTKTRHKGHVFGMYVPSERSGRGVGAALIGRVVAHAREHGLSQLALTVTAGNLAARRVYERAGFAITGREPHAIRVDGRSHDKLFMVLFLSREKR